MPARLMSLRTSPDASMHGGDVDRITRDYGITSGRLLDFSANINPAGPPVRAMTRLAREAADRDLLTRYPDPDYVELRNTLAAILTVPANGVTIANGAAALIAAIVRAAKPQECLLATPAFAEYTRALHAGGCPVRFFRLAADRAFALDVDALMAVLHRYRPGLCVLTNPHNPSGALTSKSQMLRVLDCVRRTKTVLVVDEAFIDYAPTETLSTETVQSDHLIVLRSVTKFYGMPALRVGYSVSSPNLAARLTTQLPPWPVTTLAASAAAEAIQDSVYAQLTVAAVTERRRWLRRALVYTVRRGSKA